MKRPDPFVPLSVRYATGRTGTRILEQFGLEGLAVWAAFLAACKVNRPQGEITFASEAEGWARLGLSGFEPSFTLDAFFTLTGRLKKTRRTRHGRVSYVVCTRWGDWNNAVEREAANRRMARKRATSDRDTIRTSTVTKTEQDRDSRAQEGELELEKERRPPKTTAAELEKNEPQSSRARRSADADIDFTAAGEPLAGLEAPREQHIRQTVDQLGGDPGSQGVVEPLARQVTAGIFDELAERAASRPKGKQIGFLVSQLRHAVTRAAHDLEQAQRTNGAGPIRYLPAQPPDDVEAWIQFETDARRRNPLTGDEVNEALARWGVKREADQDIPLPKGEAA